MAKRLKKEEQCLTIMKEITNIQGKNLWGPPYLPPIQTLEKDNAYRPHVHLIGDLWRFFANHKTLWRQVPRQNENKLFNRKSLCTFHLKDMINK